MKQRPTDEEFAELKRKRDEAIETIAQCVAKRLGVDRKDVCFHASGADNCYCDCPDGPCQHVWDGPEYVEESEGGGYMSSVTCSRCGMPAIYHDMRCGP